MFFLLETQLILQKGSRTPMPQGRFPSTDGEVAAVGHMRGSHGEQDTLGCHLPSTCIWRVGSELINKEDNF